MRLWTKRERTRWFRARHEVLWLVLLALLVRALAAEFSVSILNDGVALLAGAERVVHEGTGTALAGHDHPLSAWIVAGLSFLGPIEDVATWACVVAGALAVWPLHVIARRACGRHAATAACVLYAALPKAIGVSSSPLTSGIALPLFLSGISLALCAALPSSPRRRWVRLAGSGLICGVAYLARPEGLVAAAGAVLAVLTQGPRNRRLASAGVVVAAFAFVALPYVLALSAAHGGLTVSPKKDIARFVGAQDVAHPEAGRDVAAVMRGTAESFTAALTIPGVLLFVVGAFGGARRRHRHATQPRRVLFVLIAALLAIVARLESGWGYGGARHALPAALLALPFAGAGCLRVARVFFVRRTVSRRRFAVVVCAFLAVPLAIQTLLRPESESLLAARRLGESIAAAEIGRGDAAPGDVTIGSFRNPLVAYYARKSLRSHGAGARDLPLWGAHGALIERRSDTAGERADLAEHLRREDARWLVLDLFAETSDDAHVRRVPGRELAERLTEDGVIGAPVVAAGGELAAFPVR